jgi:hypothetical protein
MGYLVHLNEYRRTLQQMPSMNEILKSRLGNDPELAASMHDFISVRPAKRPKVTKKVIRKTIKRLKKLLKEKKPKEQWWDDSVG